MATFRVAVCVSCFLSHDGDGEKEGDQNPRNHPLGNGALIFYQCHSGTRPIRIKGKACNAPHVDNQNGAQIIRVWSVSVGLEPPLLKSFQTRLAGVCLRAWLGRHSLRLERKIHVTQQHFHPSAMQPSASAPGVRRRPLRLGERLSPHI